MERTRSVAAQSRVDSFGRLLRAYRMNAGLTQEALAERAGLSRRGIADLERGARLSPHQHTIDKLAESLGLRHHERAALAAAGQRASSRAAQPAVIPCLAEPPSNLVGRERELSDLRAHLHTAAAGHGRLVLLGGEAGIGKSALVSTFGRQAVARGALVLAGHAYDLSDTPPYGPWLELARDWPDDTAPLPIVSGSTPSFGAVRDALAILASERVIVLVVEDLQWADPASLELFRFLARHARRLALVLIGTFRVTELGPDHPLQALQPMLVREADAVRLTLRPLSRDAVADLVAGRYSLSAADGARVVDYLQRHGDGNPLYIRELLRTLEEVDSIRRTDGGWTVDQLASVQVPPLVRQLVQERLSRIDPDVRDLLAIGAVIGEDVPLDVLASVAGRTEDSLLEVVEHAVNAGLVVESADGRSLRFVHAIVRSVVYESLLAARRRAWHARAADVLLAASEPDGDAVAYHLRRADDDRAADWLIRASQHAERAFALVTAADRLVLAIPLLEARGISAAERGWLHFKVAQLRRWSDPERGIIELDVAERLAQEAGDQVLAAHVMLDRGWLRCTVGQLEESIAELAAGGAALEALPRENGALAGTNIVGYVHRPSVLPWVLASVGRLREALELGERFLAQPEEPWQARMACLGNAGSGVACALAYLGQVEAARQMLQRLLEGYGQVDHAGGYIVRAWVGGFHALNWLVLPYFPDRRDEWEPMLAEAERDWRRGSAAGLEPQRHMLRMPLHLLDGDWPRLRELATLARSPGMVFVWTPSATALLCQISLAQGSYDEVLALARETLPNGPATEPGGVFLQTALPIQRAAAMVALEAGDCDTAAAWLTSHDRWLEWSGAVLGQADGDLAWASYHRSAGNLATALDRASAALERASEPAQPLNLVAAYRLLAELALEQGHVGKAIRHLESAAELANACRVPYERALVQLVQADVALRQGDRSVAKSLLSQARACFTRLGARPAQARARAIATRLRLE
jgi:transcriptional regulator with XRE-family HTH domain/tetratricopeptide (TPR) repeat protein